MSVGTILPAPPGPHNATADASAGAIAHALAQRLDEVAPLLRIHRWFMVAPVTAAVAMLLGVLPGSPVLVALLGVVTPLLVAEEALVTRAASPRELDYWIAVFAAAYVVVSTVLLHIAADALWLSIVAHAVNIVAGGMALRRRALLAITALSAVSFGGYVALALGGIVEPIPAFGGEAAQELTRAGSGGASAAASVLMVIFVDAFAFPALAALSFGMTARLRAARDDLQAANVGLDATYSEVLEARQALDRWNARLNDEVLTKTLALEEQNRFLTAINAISSALNATVDDGESPQRLGQLIARLLNLEAVQFYAPPETDGRPLNELVPARGSSTQDFVPVEAALLQLVVEGAPPLFELAGADSGERGPRPLAVAVVPIVSGERPLGAIAMLGSRPVGWSDEERRLLRLVGREVGVSFENARLYRAALVARGREVALSNALNLLARDTERSSRLPQALRLISDALDATYVCLVSTERSRPRGVLFDATQYREGVDRAQLASVATALASLGADRSHAMLLGPRGESPLSAQMVERGIGSVVLAPVVARRLGEPAAEATGGTRRRHAYEAVGTVVAMAAAGQAWGAAEAEIFERLAAGIARRLESDALVAVQERRIRELSGLARLVTQMQSTIDPAYLYDGFATAMASLLEYTELHLLLIPEERSAPVLRRYGAGGVPLTPLSTAVVASWPQVNEPTGWVLPDAAAPGFLPPATRWAIGAPMHARGQPLGAMVVAPSAKPDAEMVAIAGQAAEQLALALDSALLYRQASDRAARIQVLGQLARIVASAADLREAFGVFAEEVRWLISFDRALMLVVDQSESLFEVYAAYPGAPPMDSPGRTEGSIASAALSSEQPAAFSRLGAAYLDGDWSPFGKDTDEVALVRVVAGDGTRALFALTRCAPQPFEAADLSTLEEVSSLLAVTLERVRLFEEAEYHARHDALTGLPNLRTLNQAAPDLDGELEAGASVAVLVIDMDDLKTHNDTFGHASGDEAIRIVARQIALASHAPDLVVRSGGDEFVVVVREATLAGVHEIAACLHAGLSQAALESSWPASSLGVSVGIAMSGTHGRDLRGLLRAADQAMYEAKLAGGSCTRLPGEGATTAVVRTSRRRGERVLEALVAKALAGATDTEARTLRRAQDAAMLTARECGLPLETLSTLRFLVAADAALRLASGPGIPRPAIEALTSAAAAAADEHGTADTVGVRELAAAAVELAWCLDRAPETGAPEIEAGTLAPEVHASLLAAFERLRLTEPRAA